MFYMKKYVVTKINIPENKENLFTIDGSENLGNTDMFVDDGFDIIHKHGNAFI